MTDSYFFDDIVMEETMASWLDGMMSPEENSDFISRMASSPELVDILDINDDVVEEYETMIDSGYELPDEFYDDFVLPEIHGEDEWFFRENLYGNDNGHFHDTDWGPADMENESVCNPEDDPMDTFLEAEDDSDSFYDEMSIL